mmetsp:Transcript_4393/g.6370  ORF Transcript_4393/g.6370 Transcript_4393/m.6370 type:complete len:101 (+) Transcript_4393:1538-1840(+)
MGKEGSLSNTNIIKLRGGVVLTQFAPNREAMLQKKHEQGDSLEREKSESKMTFDEKMEHRHLTEADRQAVLVLNGGEFNLTGKMSLGNYRKINPYATKVN